MLDVRIEYALLLCLFNVHSYLPTHCDTNHGHGNSLSVLPKLSQKLKMLILHHCEYGLHIIYGSLSAPVDVSSPLCSTPSMWYCHHI